MRSKQKEKTYNIWKWLFLSSALIYCLHLGYSFWSSRHSGGKESSKPSKSVNPSAYILPMSPAQVAYEEQLIKDLKETGQVGHKNKAHTGVVNGRSFIIYNNTGYIDSMVSQLHQYRQSPIVKKNTLIKDFGPRKVPFLRFVHLPKAGKSFSISMMHYCCELLDDVFIDVNMPPTHHVWKFDPSCRRCMTQPVTVNGDYFAFFPYMSQLDNGHAITLIREPTSRLAYQIDHMRRLRSQMTTYGFSHADANVLGLLVSGKVADAIKILFRAENITNIAYHSFSRQYSPEFVKKVEICVPIVSLPQLRNTEQFDDCRFQLAALYPGLMGCQTKLIIGRNCFDNIPVTQNDVDAAQNYLQKEFLFTGKFMIFFNMQLFICIYIF